MRLLTKLTFISLILLASSIATGQVAVDSRIGQLEFTKDFVNGYPTNETVAKLYDELDFQRAVQAYLWSIPLVGFVNWQHVDGRDLGAKNGQLILVETYEDKLGGLTFNVTTPYVFSFVDLLKEGPFVIETPTGGQVRGAAHDMWQIQITQMTEPGKYLFVGPDQEIPADAEREGFIVKRSTMNNFFIGVRLMPETREERIAVLQQIKPYAYSERSNPAARPFIRPDGKEWWGYQPRTMEYWERLAESINNEPIREVDRYMLAMLKPLGIEKGKEFSPDARQKKILMEALLVGEAMAKANDYDKTRLEKAHYLDGSNWHFATTADWNQRAEHYQQLDGSAAWFYEAVTNDEAMHGQETGWGQVYMGASKDNDGDWLDGAQDYVLRVPADPPAEAFWSITLYDVSTRCIIVNDQKKADLSSRQDLQYNKDGSVDLYFGPEAPTGKEANWVQTMPNKAWFPYFRLYSPTKPFLDKSWILPDIEKRND